MLEKPAIQDERIEACLLQAFGLRARRVEFLPLGADQNTAVFRVTSTQLKDYFLKLRSGAFDETPLLLAAFLSAQGIAQVIPPLPTLTGALWAEVEGFRAVLYPFIEGQSGFKAQLTAQHWRSFGEALKHIQVVALPVELKSRIQVEVYAPEWREMVRGFVRQADESVYTDPVAQKTAALLRQEREVILDLVDNAERLAQALNSQMLPTVLCHSDLHAGNILVGSGGAFYIVDWDAPILAPKERDLMYIGGGQGFINTTPQEEVDQFFRGYGKTDVNETAIAYYRYERIVQDIAAFCQQLLLSEAGGSDREQSYGYLASNFLAGGTLEIARRFDRPSSPRREEKDREAPC